MSTHYDVIIIGTGAGGGTLAYHLAPSGKRILILERGDYVPREKGATSTGSAGARISASVPGGRCAKTTALTATHGNTFHMTMPVRVRIVGTKTAWRASATGGR